MLDDLLEKLRREYIHVEANRDLDDDQKVERIILSTCAGCAALVAMPLPLADLLVLTPVQGYMGWRIAGVRGLDLSKQEAVDTAKEILGAVGLGLAARQIVITTTRVIPGVGTVFSIPLVIGATYGIGRVMDLYFRERKEGRQAPEDALRKVFKDAQKIGEAFGRKFEDSKKNVAPGSFTETFLKEKDAFVARMREAFDEAYAEFKVAVEDLKPEPASPPPAKEKRPAPKPASKPAQRAPVMAASQVKATTPKKSTPAKPVKAAPKKPVSRKVKKP